MCDIFCADREPVLIVYNCFLFFLIFNFFGADVNSGINSAEAAISSDDVVQNGGCIV